MTRPVLEPQTHEHLARSLFNYVWELMDRAQRTPAEDDEMLHAAHASRYHWGVVGGPLQRARGEWQVARVNALLGRAEAAGRHAQRYLEYCQSCAEIGPFDLAFAYEAMARAAAVAGDRAACAQHIREAERIAAQIEEADERAHLLSELKTIAR